LRVIAQQVEQDWGVVLACAAEATLKMTSLSGEEAGKLSLTPNF
jgi:hypothetical protein